MFGIGGYKISYSARNWAWIKITFKEFWKKLLQIILPYTLKAVHRQLVDFVFRKAIIHIAVFSTVG